MSLHGPNGACILVASASPIHVFPILKHCGAHKLRTPQLAGFTRQLGCKNEREKFVVAMHASMKILLIQCLASSTCYTMVNP